MGLLKFLGDKEKAFFDNGDAALADPEVRAQLDKAEDAPLTGGLVRMAEGGYHLSHAAYDVGRGDTKGAFKEGIEGFAEYEHGVGQLGKDALDTTKDIMGMAGGGGGGDEAPAPQMNPYANGREESPRPRSKTQVMPRRRGNTKVMPREHEQQERSRHRGHTQVIPHQHQQQQRSRHGGGRR